MTYLGSLLARTRPADAGPGEGAPAALRPVLPGRFEPDAPIEVTTTVEASGPVVSVPSATYRVGSNEARRERVLEPRRRLTAVGPVPRAAARSDADRPAPAPVSRTAPEPDRSMPGHEVVAAPVIDEHPQRAEAPASAAAPRTGVDANVARRPVGERPAPARTDAPRAAPDPLETVAVPPTATPGAVVDAGRLRPAAGPPELPAIAVPARRDAPPGIRVSIGRVELRAPAAPPTRPAAPQWSPRLSLDDYLRERSR